MLDRLTDWINDRFGSWRFVGWFTGVLIAWVSWNSLVPAKLQFDPFPFIFLNLFMSAMAAYTAPILLMAANRQAAKDRVVLEEAEEASTEDLMVDKDSNALIRKIAEHLGVQ